jgi:hypothetical protein
LLDHVLNFFGGLLRFLRQVAHLVGDHGKATALFASACGFDRSVESKQVGLLGNPAE